MRLWRVSGLVWCVCGVAACGGEAGLLADPAWVGRLRPEHPRLFLTRESLAAMRERAAGPCAREFEALKAEVEALPDDAPMAFVKDPVPRHPDGRLDVRPGTHGHSLFRYNGGRQAVRCALLYLLTGEEAHAAKARRYLQLAVKVLQWTAENDLWMDLLGDTRINALAAYDWVHATMTPDERRAFLLPVLDYISKAQPGGEYTFRRTIGGPQDGNYGERALMYFAGLAGHGDGIDDARCDDFLRRGAALFVEMMDHRERTSAGSGLLSAITVTYSFGAYPNATFLFLHSWRAAFGEDLSTRWTQMADYPTWFDYAMIRKGPGEGFLCFGWGDVGHSTNAISGGLMYDHLAQSIHFYGQRFPEKARRAYAVLAELPARHHVFGSTYPFVPFLLTGFDPASVSQPVETLPEAPYFHAPSFGLLVMRSGRGPKDTYVSFRCGSSLANHQHYDELSFVIYKEGFLALDAGSRTETDHHHAYAAQSVAHNTILIHEPDEPMPYFWRAWSYKPDGKTYPNHGGQKDKTAARLLALEDGPGYVYAAADATRSYAETKSREVVRQVVYIRPDHLVIYDRVASVKDSQTKQFLLHLQHRPEAIGEQRFRAENGGQLFIETLLPERAAITLEGGPGREFWASGRNWELEGGADWEKQYKVTGRWRLEISTPEPTASCRFLHVLHAAAPSTALPASSSRLSTETEDGVRIVDAQGRPWTLWFRRDGEVACRIEGPPPAAPAP